MATPDEIRQALEAADPAFLAFVDQARERFGARVTALRVGGGIDIGWDKWLALRADAITWEGPAQFDGDAEYRRIKAETIKAGVEARRKPSARQPGLL